MKISTNAQVVGDWLNGQPSRAGALITDGATLYSYALIIGYTDGLRGKVVINYTVGGKQFKSMTTSRHVGFAAKYADCVINP
jgi:hypothetical protein